MASVRALYCALGERGSVEIRLAAAPISWGICEVPGWGRMLPLERVLGEMKDLGLHATELGAAGFFPADVDDINTVLRRTEMEMLGGFVGLVMHEPSMRADTLAEAERAASQFEALGGTKFVTCPIMDLAWSPRRRLDNREWRHFVEMLDRVDDICAARGLVQVLHPHWGSVIEQAEDVQRLLETSEVKWCLDTGHLALGGTDPLRFAKDAGDRVAYVHLKDVHLARTAPLYSGAQSLMQAVQADMFCPLGTGDLPIEGVVTHLIGSGYDGWFVLEQDTAITGEDPPQGSGPVLDVRTSVEYLRSIQLPTPAPVG
jgi:inosose dehydratase